MNPINKFLYYPIVRSKISLDYSTGSRLTFLKSENTNDKINALKLVNNEYEEKGFAFRLSLDHFTNKKNTILVAKYDTEIVGTLTICNDIPMQKYFQNIPIDGCAEIKSFVIHKEFRRRKGNNIFFPFLRFFYNYVFNGNIDTIVIAIDPKHRFFYEGILLFSMVDNKVVDYSGKPAIGLKLNLRKAREEYKKVYGHKKDEKNLYKYFVNN